MRLPGEAHRSDPCVLCAYGGNREGQVAEDMRAILRTPPDPEALARLSSVSYYQGLLRTTCVATRLEAGQSQQHGATPGRAVLNCRLLPGESPEEVAASPHRGGGGRAGRSSPAPSGQASPHSDAHARVMDPIGAIHREMWRSAGGCRSWDRSHDSLYFRQAGIRVYGASGIFLT
jgi:hypothetical protein